MNDVIIVDQYSFYDEVENGILSQYLQNIGEKGNQDLYLANTNGNDSLYRLIFYVQDSGIYYSQAEVNEDLLQRQGMQFEIEEDGYVYPYSKYPANEKELIDFIQDKIKKGIENSQNIFYEYKTTLLNDLIKTIQSKDFGMIGYIVYRNGNNIQICLAQTRMGIDFGDEEDVDEYDKEVEEALEYAKKTYLPLFKYNFPELDVKISKNSF